MENTLQRCMYSLKSPTNLTEVAPIENDKLDKGIYAKPEIVQSTHYSLDVRVATVGDNRSLNKVNLSRCKLCSAAFVGIIHEVIC